MWLRDFLPGKIKNSRILIYGYNADLIGRGAQFFASILDLAKGFVNDLKVARGRPDVSATLAIVTCDGVCHSDKFLRFDQGD